MRAKLLLWMLSLLLFSGVASAAYYDYWVEEQNSTRVWTKINIPAGTTTIIITNSSGYESNGDNVFLAFDDFSDGSINTTKWNNLGATETGGYVSVDNDALTWILGNFTNATFYYRAMASADYDIGFFFRSNRTNPAVATLQNTYNGYMAKSTGYGGAQHILSRGPTATTLANVASGISTGVNYTYKIKNLGSSINFSRYTDASAFSVNNSVTDATYTTGTFSLNSDVGGRTSRFYYVFATQAVATEPTITCDGNTCNITSAVALSDYQVLLSTNLTGNLNISDSTNFTITAVTDSWNGTAILVFSANISGTWYHTTTGAIITNLLTNDTNLYNISINASTYIPKNYNNYNISTPLSGTLHQAELCLNSTAKVSGSAVTGVTYYIGSKNSTSCFNVTAATHSVVAVKAGWYNQTQSFTLTALEQENNTVVNMSYANLTIYVRAANGGAYLSSYNLNISSVNYTSWPGENQTGVTNYSWYLINDTYTVIVRKSGYATTNGTVNISVAGNTNYTFYLYEENTLNLSVYDEQTNTLINSSTITIDLIQSNQTSNYTTTNGTLYVTSLTPGEVEIRYADTASIYRGRIYILTLSNLTYQEVRLYLLNTTLGSLITLDMVDQDGQDVEGGIIKAQRFYPSENLYRTVAMTRTNFNGQGSIDMVKKSTQSNVFYKFIVEVDSVVKEETDPLEINPLTTDILYFTINVLEDIFTSWDGTDTGTVSGNLSFDSSINQFSFVWNDPTNLIREGCLKVKRITPLTETLICNNCTVSASATILCNVTNTGNLYRAEGLIETDTNNSLYTVSSLDYSYDTKSSTFGLFGVFLSVLFIGTFAMIGLWNPIVAIVLATVATIFAAILGMVHMEYATVITVIILAGIIIAKSRT